MECEQDRFREHPLFTMENIYNAYRRCRRHKRNTFNAMTFEQNMEENLVSLREELTTGTYNPGRSVAFLLEKPKQREIFAADFRDRVVHHILVGYLEPKWERRFIHDSYACRKGKGTHKGVERVRSFTRKVTANGTRRAWYLQLDIRGFFISIDRKILYERLAAKENDPAVLRLIRTLVFHEPAENCRLRRTRREDFDKLPPHKTLFKAAPRCGLPIGNLTSQFFANVYLDALDQFVKHRLRAKHYVRYCDDLVLLSSAEAELEEWEVKITEFLREHLGLELNDRRRLRPVSDGIDFLGYIVRPDYLLVRRRVVGSLRERLKQTEQKLLGLGMLISEKGRSMFPWNRQIVEEMRQWLNSYLSHVGKASGRRLILKLRSRFAWLDEYFFWQENRILLRCPAPRHAMRLSHQILWFRTRLPGHLLMIQLGKFWKVLPCDPQSAALRLPRKFPDSRLKRFSPLLWKSGLPAAWIGETGTRVCNIAERELTSRWSAEMKF